MALKKLNYDIDQDLVNEIYDQEFKKYGIERVYNRNFSVMDNGFTAKVYAYELHTLLIINIPLLPKGSYYQENDLIPNYIEGYKEGIYFFNETYKIKTDTLYQNSDDYFKDLHLKLFHGIKDQKAWINYLKSYPIYVFHARAFYEYGYYAGIYSEIENLEIKYPVLFNKIKICSEKKDDITHREIIIAHDLKVKVNLANYKSAKDWIVERGNGCRNAYYSLLKSTTNKENPFKPPTEKELQSVIEILNDCKPAQQLAINMLNNL